MKLFIDQIVFRIPGASNFQELESMLRHQELPFQFEGGRWVGRISPFTTSFDHVADQKEYDRLDRVSKLAVNLSKQIQKSPEALVIGSARGATETWEKEHAQFIAGERIHLLTSPTTTLGNLAFNAARLSGFQAATLSQSMTCSSGLHAVIEVARRIKSEEIATGIGGGVECPVTPFTIAQFEALKLLTNESTGLPSRPLGEKEQNQLILAESGALISLSTETSAIELAGYGESWAKPVHGLSFATEALESSMSKALKMAELNNVDVVLAHAPGTIQGDEEELKAIATILGEEAYVLPTKWITGHSLGASGSVSMAIAKHIFDHGITEVPYHFKHQKGRKKVQTIMINATGFGGNATSVILKRTSY